MTGLSTLGEPWHLPANQHRFDGSPRDSPGKNAQFFRHLLPALRTTLAALDATATLGAHIAGFDPIHPEDGQSLKGNHGKNENDDVIYDDNDMIVIGSMGISGSLPMFGHILGGYSLNYKYIGR